MPRVITPHAPLGSETAHRLLSGLDRLLDRLLPEDPLARLSPRQRLDVGLIDAIRDRLELDETARSLSAGRR
jgi:hypothetical protein